MIRRLGPVVLVALQGWACGETRLIDGFSEGLTRVRLAPSEFVGSVPCRKDTPGALRAYMVQIHEVTPGGADGGSSVVFTSGSVPCDQAVIVPATATRFYAAEVFGYDDSVSDAQLSRGNARWTATCGRGNAYADAGLDPYRPTFAQRGFTVAMRGCTSFFGGGDGASQLVVDQLGALGTRRCGLGAGDVSAFRGTLDGVSRTAACGEPLVFDVAGVERYHTIELVGFEADADAGPTDASTPPPDGPPVALPDASIEDAGDALDAGAPPAPVPPGDAGVSDAGPPVLVLGEPRWRTQCVGRSLPGVASPAFCDPLVPLP